MLFQRFTCEPLAQTAYLIADGDEAIVVDPRRDIDDVLAFLRENKLRARWVLATHVHADFVAGVLEVAAATGARIGIGEAFTGRMRCERLADGQVLRIGDTDVQVLSTPGHTLESSSYLVRSRGEAAGKLLTGDTLFVGDVGRPDLAQGAGMSASAMAARLFTTLRERILPLPPETEIWPAHGAGSACGSAIGGGPSSTLAIERADNWALRAPDVDTFTRRLLGALRPPPRHFPRVAAINQVGAPLVATLPEPRLLDDAATRRALAVGARVIDLRSSADYGRGHWPGAIHLGLHGNFEPWAGALLAADRDYVLHAETEERAREGRQRLLRIGIDRVLGHVLAAPADAATVAQLDAVDLFAPDRETPWQVLDVRRPDEFAAGHVPGAVHAELGPDLAPVGIDRTKPVAVICETGYRSSTAIAQLRAAGFTQLHNVRDGMRGWRTNNLPQDRAAPSPTATS